MQKPDIIIEESAKVLKTPLCDFWIEDIFENRVAFDVIQYPQNYHTVYLNNDPDQEIEAENFFDCTMRIATKNLMLNKDYYICCSKPLEYRDSDEHLFTYGITLGDKTLAISFPDPNDEIKMDFILKGVEYTKGDLERYDIDENLVLCLFDREDEYIYFNLAWIWGINDHMADYESAAEVWTWCL